MKVHWIHEGSYQLDDSDLATLTEYGIDPATATGEEVLEALDLDTSSPGSVEEWVTQ